MKVLAIVQARLGSTRFPGKVLKKFGKKTIIQVLIERLSKSKLIDKIVIATTKSKKDDKLVNHIRSFKKDIFRGSENDLLDRFYKTAKIYKPQYIYHLDNKMHEGNLSFYFLIIYYSLLNTHHIVHYNNHLNSFF